MSYDVNFCIKEQHTGKLVQLESVANITYNVHDLIRESSTWEIKNLENNGTASEIVLKAVRGVCELKLNPEKYVQYESPNGWGTIGGTIRFYERIISAWTEVKATYPDLIDYIYVYVD